MKGVFTLLFFTVFGSFILYAQPCATGESLVTITLETDNWGYETSWQLTDHQNNVLLSVELNEYESFTTYSHEACIETGTCTTFSLFDSFGDGGPAYQISIDGVVVAAAESENFGHDTFVQFNCPLGSGCTSPIVIEEGEHIAPQAQTWYAFQPDSIGTYAISTCDSNSCDTKIWIYDDCSGILVDSTNAGTVYYDDNDGGCGLFAQLPGAVLDTAVTYYIRIGDAGGDCAGQAIHFSIEYNGPVVGCTDPNSCNYNPLATVDDGTCLPHGHEDCPNAPDLVVLQGVLESSIYLTTYDNNDECLIEEGCMNGYGTRDIIRFSTHIKNIGDADYFIGVPSEDNSQFTYDNCHQHYHYDGYAEYILYDENGNELPIGFKNGFCVLDLECSDGGIPQFGCGYMGISKQCGDIYGSGLRCQWIDVTDLAEGDYTFVTRTNWDNAPDGMGRVEKDTLNNWAQVCINLSRASGALEMTLIEDCPIYVDCQGNLYGSAQVDCQGICGGSAIMGDMNDDGLQAQEDLALYTSALMIEDLEQNTCNDFNADSEWTIYDAALLNSCLLYGQLHGHEGSGLHDHCNFPAGIVNVTDTVALSILEVNLEEKFVDIGIHNQVSDVVAFQFELSGITTPLGTQVENLVGDDVFPASLTASNMSAKIYGISYTDKVVPRSQEMKPLLRIHYDELTGDSICIANIVDIVNHNYEQTIPVLEGNCFSGIISSTSSVFQTLPLSVQPNPFTRKTTISFENRYRESLNIEISDLTGKVLRRFNNIRGEQIEIARGDLAAGVYILKLKSKKGLGLAKLFVQ